MIAFFPSRIRGSIAFCSALGVAKQSLEGVFFKQFLKAFGVAFKVENTEKSPYNPEFVKKILATKNEKSTRINPENIWESIL